MNGDITFEQLNMGWNAEPNAPELSVTVNDTDVVIEFYFKDETFECIASSCIIEFCKCSV